MKYASLGKHGVILLIDQLAVVSLLHLPVLSPLTLRQLDDFKNNHVSIFHVTCLRMLCF